MFPACAVFKPRPNATGTLSLLSSSATAGKIVRPIPNKVAIMIVEAIQEAILWFIGLPPESSTRHGLRGIAALTFQVSPPFIVLLDPPNPRARSRPRLG